MTTKLVFWAEILGVTFFVLASFSKGFQFDNYNPVSQLISATMAVDMPKEKHYAFLDTSRVEFY